MEAENWCRRNDGAAENEVYGDESEIESGILLVVEMAVFPLFRSGSNQESVRLRMTEK